MSCDSKSLFLCRAVHFISDTKALLIDLPLMCWAEPLVLHSALQDQLTDNLSWMLEANLKLSKKAQVCARPVTKVNVYQASPVFALKPVPTS
jgi:hypothetical protein